MIKDGALIVVTIIYNTKLIEVSVIEKEIRKLYSCLVVFHVKYWCISQPPPHKQQQKQQTNKQTNKQKDEAGRRNSKMD